MAFTFKNIQKGCLSMTKWVLRSRIVPLVTPETQRVVSVATNYDTFEVNHHELVSRSLSSASTEEAKDASPLSHFLAFYDSAYAALVCPFRIGKDEKGKLVIQKHRLQTVLCACVQVMFLIRFLSTFRKKEEDEEASEQARRNPVEYFKTLQKIASFIHKLTTLKRFWFNQEEYLDVVTFLVKKSLLYGDVGDSKLVKILRSTSYLRTLFRFPIFLMVTRFVYYDVLSLHKESFLWPPDVWFNHLVKTARFSLFLDGTFDDEELSILNVLLVILYLIGTVHWHIHYIFSNLLLLCHTLSLWIPANSLANRILEDVSAGVKGRGRESETENDPNLIQVSVIDENHPDGEGSDKGLKWADLFPSVRRLHKLAMTIQIASGSQMSCFIATSVMGIPLALDGSWRTTSTIDLLFSTPLYLLNFGILLLSPNICSQVGAVGRWLTCGDNKKSVPADEMDMVLHEIYAKDIGIKGSNAFTITYTFVGELCLIMLSYFIICLQAK